jgi:hypothetical protein
MDLKKLPPSLLVVLGLACTRSQPPTVGPCLSQPYDPSDVGPCLSIPVEPDPTDGGTTGTPTEPGPIEEPEPTVGPCLSPPEPSAALSETTPASQPAATRHDALERVLARAALPPDVAARLRQRSDLD